MWKDANDMNASLFEFLFLQAVQAINASHDEAKADYDTKVWGIDQIQMQKV